MTERERFEVWRKNQAWAQVADATSEDVDDDGSFLRLMNLAAFSSWQARAAIAEQDVQLTERKDLQSKGMHPAPCAGSCEATAFYIEIRSLKAQLAAPVAAQLEEVTKSEFPKFIWNVFAGKPPEPHLYWSSFLEDCQSKNTIQGVVIRAATNEDYGFTAPVAAQGEPKP